jgi:hypothetical protein
MLGAFPRLARETDRRDLLTERIEAVLVKQ